MIRWCAYCQHYQGEQEPLDDYSITHDICEPCLASGAMENPRTLTLVQPAIKFFNKLQKATAKKDVAGMTQLMEDALNLGIEPRDLTLGVVRPLLYRVRGLYEDGHICLADEYRFTAAAWSVMEVLFQRAGYLKHMRMHKNPEALLVCVEGNTSFADVRIAEFHLASAGVTTHVVVPGLPADDIVKLVAELKPKTLAVSASHPNQYQALGELANKIKEMDIELRPQVVVGGEALRKGADPLPKEWGVVTMVDLTDLASQPAPAGMEAEAQPG